MHRVPNARKSSWTSNGIPFTLLTRGHRVNPWQSVHYMAIRTIRRVVGRREGLQRVLMKWLSIEADGTANESAGAVSVLEQAMVAVG